MVHYDIEIISDIKLSPCTVYSHPKFRCVYRMRVYECMYVCVCMRACVGIRVRLRTWVRACKRKRNKATLSWLRLVCCRHEVPVTSEPITVIHMDEDVVVVNKPASIPVSGVLPELYCQKVVLSHCPPSTKNTHVHTFTHMYSHVSLSSCMSQDGIRARPKSGHLIFRSSLSRFSSPDKIPQCSPAFYRKLFPEHASAGS